MSNRTLYSSFATYTAREREAVEHLVAFSMNQFNRISLNDIALVADILRQLLLHETLQEETPDILRPDLPGSLPSQD